MISEDYDAKEIDPSSLNLEELEANVAWLRATFQQEIEEYERSSRLIRERQRESERKIQWLEEKILEIRAGRAACLSEED